MTRRPSLDGNKERLVFWPLNTRKAPKINGESSQDPNTKIDLPNTEKQEQSNRNKPQSNDSRKITHLNHTKTNTRKNECRYFKENCLKRRQDYHR